MLEDVKPKETDKDKLVESTYKEITSILRLLKGAKKLTNDIVGAQIAAMLMDELRSKHELVNYITKD